jgi:hypothetical protein|tara:strand:+ start:81 stop:290 length:210 start_codon:yes stop_codon:yes gene_type:complete
MDIRVSKDADDCESNKRAFDVPVDKIESATPSTVVVVEEIEQAMRRCLYTVDDQKSNLQQQLLQNVHKV